MKTEKLTWGLILVFIGTIFLLTNLGVIDFYWGSVWRLWPVIFIIAGLNIILNRYMPNGGSLIAACVTLIILGFVAFTGMRPSDHRSERNTWHFNYDDSHKREKDTFTEPYLSQTKYAVLNVIGGAASYKLSDSTANLFDADVEYANGRYSLRKTSTDSIETLTFKSADGKKSWNFGDGGGDDADIRLNVNPIWDVNIKMGAGEADFDLSSFKVKKVDISGGAASFNLKLGMPQAITNVNVETGLAGTDIRIPKGAGCKISVKTGLSSEDFRGFVKQDKNNYVTPGFDEKLPHFIINLKGGLADFEVRRY